MGHEYRDGGVTTPTTGGVGMGYILKLNNQGVGQWVKTVSSEVSGSMKQIAIDSSGNIYGLGWVDGDSGSANIGGVYVTFPSVTGGIACIMQVDSSGMVQWAQVLGTGGDIGYPSALAIDAAGNLYVAGDIWGSGTFNFSGLTGTSS